MKTEAVLIALLTLAATFLSISNFNEGAEDVVLYEKYTQWKAQYNKNHSATQDITRFAQWAANFNLVEAQNALEDGLILEMNQFADMDLSEFAAKMLTRQSVIDRSSLKTAKRTYAAVPASVDWRSKGVVAPIQNQGVCGSCWAFSAVATLTSLQAIKSGNLVQYSEQQLVSCDTQSLGCDGGDETAAMANYTPKYGCETSEQYPYVQLNNASTASCKYSSSNASYKNSGAKQIAANSPDAMKEQVAANPISIAINGASIYFQLYSSGVLKSANCGTNLDHAVNIVGYNTSDSTPYWIVRNSWGTSWGQAGYAFFAILDGVGVCGSQMEPSYAY